ncbi:5-(carboxyamino)imidazole ribonucleotide synthase [Vibrio sp.]|nr:5-(carboxyamino)imidazole ribonucleotide synthase [Vibrio sp.]
MKVLILGSGQLARMMALAGAPLNINIIAYDVVNDNVVHPLTQQDFNLSLDEAIKLCDVVTAEFEHVPHHILDTCEASKKLYPYSQLIKIGGDRREEKHLLDNAQVPNAKYTTITSKVELHTAIDKIGPPLVLKTALGGYDGKGQWRIKQTQDIDTYWPDIQMALSNTPNQAIVAEQFIPFDREVSIIGVRGKSGDIALYPIAENIHINGVLGLSKVIDEPELQQQAESIFKSVATSVDYIGVLALEFFDVSGQLIVNEIAPRVHNSGHWTQQGADVCQFENHIRAVCGLPLGSTQQSHTTTMINILGEDTLPKELLMLPGCHIHWYGKEKRSGRKMGHINVIASNEKTREKRLQEIASILSTDSFPVLNTYKL